MNIEFKNTLNISPTHPTLSRASIPTPFRAWLKTSAIRRFSIPLLSTLLLFGLGLSGGAVFTACKNTPANPTHQADQDHDHEHETTQPQGSDHDQDHAAEADHDDESPKSPSEGDHNHEAGTSEGAALPSSTPPKAAERLLDLDEKTAKKWNIRTAPPELRDYVEKITLTGVMKENSDTSYLVGAQLPGVASRALRDIGDTVKKGDILCELVSQELLDLKTRYIKAIQDYRQKKESFARARDLLNIKALEQKEFINRESEYKTAQAELFSLEAALVSSGASANTLETVKSAVKEDREAIVREFLTPLYRIPSPAAGRVVMREFTPGERIENSRVLFEISDTRNMWAVLDLLEKDLPLAEKGTPLTIVSDIYPDTKFQAVIQTVMEKLDPQLRTVKIRALTSNPDGRLKAEMYIRGLLETKSRRKILAVPSASLVKIGGAIGVFVEAPGHGFAFRSVQTADTDADGFTFIPGLAPSDRVVIDGAFYLKAEMEIQTGGADPHAGHNH